MRLTDLVWAIPLLIAVAAVVGTAGRRRGEIGPAVLRNLILLSVALVVVGLVVRGLVIFFA